MVNNFFTNNELFRDKAYHQNLNSDPKENAVFILNESTQKKVLMNKKIILIFDQT
jgi:hypothetical protein